MKRYFMILLSAAALLPLSHACLSRTLETVIPGGTACDPATVTLEVECPGMELITRALDPTQESAVHDLNIYFFSRKFPDDIARHVYTNGGVSRVPVDLFPADYDMYVIANVGRDLGERSREQIAGYTATVASEQELTRAGRLPMAVHQEVSVTGDASLSVNLV